MKVTSFFTVIIIAMSVFLTGCMASHSGTILNGTNVQLSQNNFSYIATNLTGEASVTYIFGFGGMAKSSLVFEAKQNLQSQQLLGDGQAWVNQTVNYKTSVQFGIVVTKKCIISADIVQFK